MILREKPNVTPFGVVTFGRKTALFAKMGNSTPIRTFPNATFHRRKGATAKAKRPNMWTRVSRHGPHLSGPLPAIKACLAFRESLSIPRRCHGMTRAWRPPTCQRHVQAVTPDTEQRPTSGQVKDYRRTSNMNNEWMFTTCTTQTNISQSLCCAGSA